MTKDTDPEPGMSYCSLSGSLAPFPDPKKERHMNATRVLMALALVPIACTQGAQNAAPPAATATPAPSLAVSEAPGAPAVSVTTAASPASAPSAPSKPAVPRSSGQEPAPPQTASPAQVPAARSTASAAAPVSEKGTSVPPAAPPPPRVRLVVPAGTRLPVQIETTISSKSSKEGDPVLAILTEDVALEGFKLDKGAEVRGQVIAAVPAQRVKGRARLAVAFNAVMENGEKLSISTEAIDNMAASTSGKDKKVIAGAAVGGLIVGAIKDGTKGAAVGTVVGAAAGTGAVLIMKGDEVELPRGARLSVVVTK